MSSTSGLLLEVHGLEKSYGGTRAIRHCDFEVRRGEVMALLGENGTGKSTLVKTLSGLVEPDEGTVTIAGRPLHLGSPRAARAAGIAVVTQELSIVPELTVSENVMLGSDLRGPWTRRRLERVALPHLEAVGVAQETALVPAGQLTIAEQQLVEIARALARQADLVILDEPTAALADNDIERVKDIVRRLKNSGRGVVYVTHRLEEVFEVADRATVMRDGRSQDPIATSELTVDSLIERMLGRKLDSMYPDAASTAGDVRLELQDLLGEGMRTPVTLSVRAGEIVGIASQIGGGAPGILRAVAGVSPARSGSVAVDGQVLQVRTMKDAVTVGIAYCSSDRKRDGIFEKRTVQDSFTAPSLRAVTPSGWYRPRLARRLATRLAIESGLDVGKLGQLCGALSGGNQQKVALGKWLGTQPKILLVDEPTRGVDVGARAEIYSNLRRLTEEGMSVVFVSSDTQEVAGLSDRVMTVYKGSPVRIAPDMTEDEILRDVTHGGGVRAG